MITSTDQAFTELGMAVPVDTYTRDESHGYLRDRTGLDDDTGADGVADELGDHPLALAQAAATIRRRHWTYQTYLDHLAHTPITQLLTAASRPRLPAGHRTGPAPGHHRPGGRRPHRAHQPDPAAAGRAVPRRCPPRSAPPPHRHPGLEHRTDGLDEAARAVRRRLGDHLVRHR